jgi:hypothetical protein
MIYKLQNISSTYNNQMEVTQMVNFKSKTVWAAGLGGICAVASAAGYAIPTELYALLGSAGLYGLRDAISKK